jgi:carbon-monoxide dehydrogenase iron sulfur subunit
MKKVYVREEYCVACGLCQVYCATQHSQYPDDVLKAFRLSSRKPLPRLLVEKKASLSFAWQCRHCDNAACVSACISGAMSKDASTGEVLVDENRCIGCATCVVACPYGTVVSLYPQQSLVLKCDLCQGRQLPVCVLNCPNEALVYGEELVK